MKRLLILAALVTILIPAAGCNCFNRFRRQESCGYTAPPPVQAGCASEGQQYLAPVGTAPIGEIYGPAPQ
jgi:hypothetical protein